jgi:hypothetical protein
MQVKSNDLTCYLSDESRHFLLTHRMLFDERSVCCGIVFVGN